MKKYFIHNGTENTGPFSLEELKKHEITNLTPIWYEGLEEWTIAAQVEELQSLLIKVPIPPKSTVKQDKTSLSKVRLKGLNGKYFIIGLSIFLLLLFIVLKLIQNERQAAIEKENQKTAIDNEASKSRQKERETALQQEQIKDSLDQIRLKELKKETVNHKREAIEKQLTANYKKLESAKNELIEVTKFKLLRSKKEKKAQILSIQETISAIEYEIFQLEKDLHYVDLNSSN